MGLTQAQKYAVTIRNRNILVSAAAGSGKTSTLTKRIIQLLTDPESPADISSMLIVTFTRAAAGELRDKISERLTEELARDPGNQHLAEQLTALGSASIQTIDAFYLDVVRSNFQRLGLPASFRLADTEELSVLKQNTMEAVIERELSEDPEFSLLSDAVSSVNSDNQLEKKLIDLCTDLNRHPEGIGVLNRCADLYEQEADQDFFASRAGRVLHAEVRSVLGTAEDLLRRQDALAGNDPDFIKYQNNITNNRESLDRMKAALEQNQYSTLAQVVSAYQAVRRPNIKNKTDEMLDLHTLLGDFSDLIKDLKEKVVSTPQTVSEAQRHSAVLCRTLFRTLNEFEAAYSEEKKQRSVCEFSDLTRYVLRLFLDEDRQPTAVALAMRERFTHIFVDEYQDTNSVQDLVFNTISNGHNLFFVGDIKQSIYYFRGAEPSLFAGYRRKYPEFAEDLPEGPCSVFMSENFRSAKNVLRFTNAVCGRLFRMSEDAQNPGIGYKSGDDLVFSRKDGDESHKVHLRIMEETNASKNETGSKGQEIEARYVVGQIRSLIASGRRPEDIAVLTSKNDHCEIFSSALADAGIPVMNYSSEDLFENGEVLMMLSLLSAIDNPQRDVQLAGALRSPLFGFSLTDLVNIRCGRTDQSLFDALCEYAVSPDSPDGDLAARAREVIRRLDQYRLTASSVPIHRFIRLLWKECGVDGLAGSDSDKAGRSPEDRKQNLRKLYDFARKFEASAFRTLHDFILYINTLIENRQKIENKTEKSTGRVHVMTIHKSKGLEFPVVFLVRTASALHSKTNESDSLFLSDGDIGFAAAVTGPDGIVSVRTPMLKTAQRRRMELELEEKIRVLYVGLTRAKDELFITAGRGPQAKTKKLFFDSISEKAERIARIGGRYALFDNPSFIEWILAALDLSPDKNEFCDLQSYVDELPGEHETAEPQLTQASAEMTGDTNWMKEELLRRFAFEYPYSGVTAIPAKLSVSRLYPDVLTGEEQDDDEFRRAAELLRRAEEMEPRVPRFMGGKENAAERGTATHLFLQFCDFSRLDGTVSAARAEGERLTALGFIPRTAFELIRFREIAAFSAGDFFRRLRSAREVRRETRFNIFLPAADFTQDPAMKKKLADEKLMVQGVIDLYFTDSDGRMTLCDYKTDRLTEEELADPEKAAARMREVHGQQLSYYAAALEQLEGKRPDRICIFSLHLGRELEIRL